MIPNRLKRLSSLMIQTISEVIRKELKDPRIGFVTITDVEISPDLRHAKVFVSAFGDDSQKDAAVAGLNSASGFIYKQIRPEIAIKRVPSLRFFRDDSIERGVKVCDVIRRARESDPKTPEEEA
jgi:ribosome-binding factor A